MNNDLIFDSYALLKFFQRESGYESVMKLLKSAQQADVALYLNAINLGEIIYTTKRRFGDQQKLEALAHIERLGFTILPIPTDLVFRAAEYKGQYAISYADCFLLASAVEHAAVVVTGDPEFEQVAHLIHIEWI